MAVAASSLDCGTTGAESASVGWQAPRGCSHARPSLASHAHQHDELRRWLQRRLYAGAYACGRLAGVGRTDYSSMDSGDWVRAAGGRRRVVGGAWWGGGGRASGTLDWDLPYWALVCVLKSASRKAAQWVAVGAMVEKPSIAPPQATASLHLLYRKIAWGCNRKANWGRERTFQKSKNGLGMHRPEPAPQFILLTAGTPHKS